MRIMPSERDHRDQRDYRTEAITSRYPFGTILLLRNERQQLTRGVVTSSPLDATVTVHSLEGTAEQPFEKERMVLSPMNGDLNERAVVGVETVAVLTASDLSQGLNNYFALYPEDYPGEFAQMFARQLQAKWEKAQTVGKTA